MQINVAGWDPSEGGSISYADISSIPSTGRITGVRRIAAEDAPSRARRRARDGDVLVSTVRPYLRAFARVASPPDNFVASTGYAVLTPRDSDDTSFVYQLVLLDSFIRHLEPRMTGTGYPAVRPDDVGDFAIAIPPPEERRHVAAVLDAIDDAIEKTEAVIAATEQLRAALLAELLTRGIPGRHTEWKHVRGVGTVPACWQVHPLSALGPDETPAVLTGPFGSQLPASEYVSAGVPLLTIGSVRADGIDASRLIFVPEGTADRLSRYRVKAGDILFSRVATVGRVAAVTQSYDGALISYNLMRLRLDSGRLLPELVMESIDALPAIREAILGVTSGGARQVVNTTSLGQLRLPIPPLDEQQLLTSIAADIREARRREESASIALRALKTATAEALLSGRVRVSARAVPA